jgi:Carboxypeptidase regulatory-like domain
MLRVIPNGARDLQFIARRCLFALCLLSSISAVVHAQLRGVVRDGPTRAPLSGAVVTVLDRDGATTVRTITDAEGRFSVGLGPSAASLRVVRIGFRPRDVALPSATGSTLEIVMERIPPMLNAVRVTDNELCPGSADRGTAFQVWEQARAGLLATVVARELKPANARTLTYESRLAPNDERVQKQTKHIATGRTTRPFVAPQTPVYFARHGYIIEDPSMRIYNAPDADVLLDESFATTHCFHVQAADADHKGQIGLAFTPSPGRDTLADVTGVIWIDGNVPQLRSLDFLYTSLERAAMAMKTGGHIEFRTMPNGVAFVERWYLRLPALEMVPLARRTGIASQDLLRPPTRQERTDFRVHEIIEAGGMVLGAKWDDAEYHDTPAVIKGTVTQRRTNAPVSHAIVTLVGTPDTVLTDDAGQFSFDVVPGKYGLSVTDTVLHSYVQSRAVSQTVSAVRAQTTSTHLELAPLNDVVQELCRDVQVYDHEVILLGHVFAPDKPRIPNASVAATWIEPVGIAGDAIVTRTARRDSDVDNEGRFVICGVPVARLARMKLMVGRDALADTTFRFETPDLTQPFEWRIAPLGTKPPPGARR